MEAVESFLARIPEGMDPADEPEIEPVPGVQITPNGRYWVASWLSQCIREERRRGVPEAVRLEDNPDFREVIHERADFEWAAKPPASRREWINRTYANVATTYGLGVFTEALLWLVIRLVIRYLWALYNRKPSCAPRLVI